MGYFECGSYIFVPIHCIFNPRKSSSALSEYYKRDLQLVLEFDERSKQKNCGPLFFPSFTVYKKRCFPKKDDPPPKKAGQSRSATVIIRSFVEVYGFRWLRSLDF